MATPENAATERDATSTRTSSSAASGLAAPNSLRLREDAPRIDTIEALTRKNEQVFDALDRGALTPKQGEQMNQTLKAIFRLKIDTPLRLISLVAKHKGKIPIPREPMLRTMLGLNAKPEPTDAALLESSAR